jgi:PAS domain S-box-containing protein
MNVTPGATHSPHKRSDLEGQMQNDDEISRLQSCINNLISVLALPAIWSGSESSQVVGTLLDVLLAMLRLDFAYARLSDSSEGPSIEVVRLADPSARPQQVAQAVGRWLTGDQAASRFVIPNPAGEGEVSLASFSLGLQAEVGVLVAGVRRADFPTDIERLLLRVAANQAGIGLQEARRSGEQKRIAETLEQRVAERTRRLTAVNDELRRSEAYLAEAQRFSHTGSFGWRVSTGEIIWSEETLRIFQYDRTTTPTVELILQRVHPEDVALVKQTIERASQDGKNFEHEYRLLMPDGSIKHVHVVAHALSDEWGSVEFVGAVMDVTERRRAEALRDGESRILEMIASDAQLGEILEKLVRVVEAQFPGLLCSVLLLDEDARHVRHAAAPSLPQNYTKAIDGLCIGPKTGSCGTAMYRREPVVVTDILQDPLWEQYRGLIEPYGLRACWSTPILAHSGKTLGSFGMYYCEPRSPSPAETRALEMATHLAGIAIERKLTHEQLQRSEAYLAEAQRLSHTGSWAFNDREAVYWSEENFRIWGFNPQHGLPNRETVLQRIHPEDRDRVVEYVEKAVREKRDYVVEFRIVLPEGTVKHIRGLGHPVFNASGELIEVVGTQLDVTERKRAEEEREKLRQLQADLAHIHRVTTMGELTASLAHEVNQPIAAAVTDAKTCVRWLTRDHPDLEEAREAATRMVKDATRAAEIISRTRLLFKKSTPERELVDINEVIREMIVLLCSEATRYSISVRAELADLPQVLGDRVQLQQVLMNLMTNGIDAMKDVDGTRELIIRSRQAEDDQLMVSVSDTGVGLPAQQAGQIFNAFFTTKPHGTGMGLRISRSIVEAHGGRLWAADNSPRGANFHLTLPTQVEAQVP